MWIIKYIKKAIEALNAENLTYLKEKSGKISLSNILDPFAKEISWLPNKWWWANFKTNVLIKDSLWNYKYRVSYWTMLFSGMFVMFGVFFTFGIVQLILQNLNKWNVFKYEDWVIFMVFPILFLIAGILVYIQFSKRKEFNLINSCCYIWKKVINFNEIYAVQLISETIHRRPVYSSYEINLVLKNKERINIIDHGNKEAILLDSQLISNILWVPIWNTDQF